MNSFVPVAKREPAIKVSYLRLSYEVLVNPKMVVGVVRILVFFIETLYFANKWLLWSLSFIYRI